jgi:predicted amidohydrolase YtcJ
MVVLAENPLTCPDARIKDISVEMTIVNGQVVHGTHECKMQNDK